jgi:hypothetical protein
VSQPLYQVQESLFVVPRHRFPESDYFASLLSKHDQDLQQGGFSQDGEAIRIDDISAYDFRSFLKLLYPLYVAIYRKANILSSNSGPPQESAFNQVMHIQTRAFLGFKARY